MKILLSITSLGMGGAERLVANLADRFVALGHQVVLVYFHGEPSILPADPRVQLINIKMRRSVRGVFAALCRFRKLLIDFQPDVVNSHLVHANILTRLLRLVTPMPGLVSSAHNNNEEGWGRMFGYNITDRLADMSTNVSQQAVQIFEQKKAVHPGRMVVIHNGIDTHYFGFDIGARQRVRAELGLEKDASLLLAVGRLRQSKDYPNLFQAFAALHKAGPLPYLVIAGDGPLRRELESLACSLAITERVRFLGVRNDIPALMSACDLFVLSSAREGFGLVVAEAMACERPVVATDCGGVREVVGDAGFLVPPRDSEALATSLDETLRLPADERQRLGRAARSRVVEHFSLSATAERYLAVYQSGRRA